jgi:hypothetical protein
MLRPKQVHIYVEKGSLLMRYWWKGQFYMLRPPDCPDTPENRT